VDCDPLTALVPDHAPEAVHAVALVEDQVSVELPPEASELGLALILTVGAADGVPATVTVADWVAEPLGPLQVKPNWVVFVSGPIDLIPPVETLPCQPPEAVQEVELEVFQNRVAVPPLLMVAGAALNVIFGVYAEAAASAVPLTTAASELSAASRWIDLSAKLNHERWP
jgi:hypothetical protein